MIQIGGRSYEVIKDYKDGWNLEAFKQRYSEVLDRYDYIIGDWGYNQLRLKGFYRDNHPKVTRDTAFSGITDYINEYCNFGCPYFVVQKTKESQKDKDAVDKDQPVKERASSSKERSSSAEDQPQPIKEKPVPEE